MTLNLLMHLKLHMKRNNSNFNYKSTQDIKTHDIILRHKVRRKEKEEWGLTSSLTISSKGLKRKYNHYLTTTIKTESENSGDKLKID